MAKKKSGGKSIPKGVDPETGEIKEWEDPELQEALINGTEEELLERRQVVKDQAGGLQNVRDILGKSRKKRMRGVSSFGGQKRIMANQTAIKPAKGSD